MMKYLLTLILVLFATNAYSAPSVDTVTGTISHGETVVISGSSFGSKSQAAPFKYDNFDDGVLDNVFTSQSAANSLATSGNRSANSLYFVTNDGSTGGGNIEIASQSYSTTEFYSSAWFKWTADVEWNDPSSSNGQQKMFRIGSGGSDGDYPNVTYIKREIVTAGTDRGTTHNGENIPEANDVVYSTISSTWMDDAEWHRVEYYVKMSSGVGVDDAIVKAWVDGVLVLNRSDIAMDDGSENTLNGIWSVNPSIIGLDAGQVQTDEVYFDTTEERIELGNNFVFANCTHREIQVPTAWSDTSVTITLNKGSFSDTQDLFLFVIDSDGTASAGFPIQYANKASITGTTRLEGVNIS